jgi:Dolichyl-phosphate-mannose-protein mannosyltransferase
LVRFKPETKLSQEEYEPPFPEQKQKSAAHEIYQDRTNAIRFYQASPRGIFFGHFDETHVADFWRGFKIKELSVRHSPGVVGRIFNLPDMADDALKAKPVPVFFSEGSLKALIVSILAYWGVYALIAPVTNSDSQVYNLARLSVAERAGFWQATAWNSVRQVMFPWTFDAIHYPFLVIGWGSALPSFLAFLGLLIIIFELVAPRFGSKVGLWSILILLAMPTLMLQATTTKNDLVIAFGAGCWLYSLVRFRRKQNTFFLFTAALSLAFTIGCKTSALPICAILTLATGWLLRKQLRSALWFALLFGLLLLLFGSIETYILSWQVYHEPLGPTQFVSAHTNRDGIRGAAANFIRYYMASISSGIDGVDCRSGLPQFLEEKCRLLLGSLNLRNAGCRVDFTDANMPFLKDGSDSGSDYGLVGFLALLVSSVVIWRPSYRKLYWILDFLGFTLLAFTCLTIVWMPWNLRYLCLSFILFGLSLAMLIFESPNDRSWKQVTLGLIIIWSAISLPLHCGQRRPLDFWNAFFARTDLSLKQKWEMRQVYDDVLSLRMNNKDSWFLVAGENSWTLPFLTQPRMDWQLTPRWNQVSKALRALTEPNDAFALVLDSQLPQNIPYEILKTYPHSIFILRIPSDARKQL